MIYRLTGSHLTLQLISLSVLIGTAGIMTDQIKFLTTNHKLNFIAAEVSMEENIAILIAAFGVFLEYRHWLLDRKFPDGIPDAVHNFDRYAHDVGVTLILIAIFIEATSLFFLAFSSWGVEFSGLKYLEVAMIFVANISAVLIISRFGIRSLKVGLR